MIAALLTACGTGVPTASTTDAGSTTIAPARTGTPLPGQSTRPASTTAAGVTTAQPSIFNLAKADLQGKEVEFWYVLPERVRLEGQADPVQTAVAGFNSANEWGIRVNATPFQSIAAPMIAYV